MLKWVVRGVLLLIAAVVVLAILGAGYLFYQSRSALDGNPEYVALGSSFASGPGITVRVPGSSYPCGRSVDNYAHQLARKEHLSLVDMTCNGATTENILRHGQFFQPRQIDAVGPATKLVTVTIGGNDVDYMRNMIALHCSRSSGDVSGWQRMTGLCKPLSPSAIDAEFGPLPANMREIASEVRQRAPHARLIFLTYLSVLPPTGTCARVGLTAEQADRMRGVATRLHEITRAAAKDTGADFVDSGAISADHNACAADPWVNGFVFDMSHGKFAYHPNLAGMTAQAEALDQSLQKHP
jgi:lysophospholipase L1-like esterase